MITRKQKQELKEWFGTQYPAVGIYYHIPEALFSLVRRGLPLKQAKAVFLEIVHEQGYSLTPTSLPILEWRVLDGSRGIERVLRWYVTKPYMYSHFMVSSRYVTKPYVYSDSNISPSKKKAKA